MPQSFCEDCGKPLTQTDVFYGHKICIGCYSKERDSRDVHFIYSGIATSCDNNRTGGDELDKRRP